jgi:hypothetical protein
MIGSPFNFGVEWDSIQVKVPGIGIMTMADGGSQSVGGPVGYDGSGYYGGGYGQDSVTIDILDPFQGYWVENLEEEQVDLLVPPIEAPSGKTRRSSVADGAPVEEGAWKVLVRASSCGARDTGLLGVKRGADNEWDLSDRSELPMCPGRAISLYFPHSSWAIRPGAYSTDFRSASEGTDLTALGYGLGEGPVEGHVWPFDIAKNFAKAGVGDEVNLEFRGLEKLPSEYLAFLVDRSLGSLVDLGLEAAYRFHLGLADPVLSEDEARFLLIVGSHGFVDSLGDRLPSLPERTTLHRNHPNPFAPSTIIRYDVASACEVRLSVYDVRGALVRELHDGRCAPGRYETVWEGTDERGRRVPSGVYFCRFDAGSGVDETRKLILVR